MQNPISKFLLSAIFIAFSLSQTHAQVSNYRLQAADSLFQAKQYTQSYEQYMGILKNNEYTSAMFLKMAFIQEGLGHTGEALYYLTLYHRTSNDPSALRKMDELAAKYNLEGYKTTDTDWFLTWYNKFYQPITLTAFAICILLLAIALYRKFRLEKRPLALGITLMVFLVLLFVHLNLGSRLSSGIITASNAYIMNGPSPGADVVEIVKEGHRIEIVGRNDVWLKIKWNGSIAYIKENSVKPILM